MHILTFRIDAHRYALPLADVREVVRAVAIEPLPGAPDVVEGVVNYRGRAVPALDLRRRFGLPARGVSVQDHLIIARAGARLAAVRADRATELLDVPDDAIARADEVTAATGSLAGVVTLDDGVVLLHDLAAFLSQAERERLEESLSAGGTR